MNTTMIILQAILFTITVQYSWLLAIAWLVFSLFDSFRTASAVQKSMFERLVIHPLQKLEI